MMDKRSEGEIRLDKWLWAARFFKTRSLAADAVTGGKVEVNGARAKPSRTVRPGDQVNIRRGPYDCTVTVEAISSSRGPAPQAQALYTESEESIRKRETIAAQLKLERPSDLESSGRPSKKDRRTIRRFTKRGW